MRPRVASSGRRVVTCVSLALRVVRPDPGPAAHQIQNEQHCGYTIKKSIHLSLPPNDEAYVI